MKKIALLLACISLALGAFAQTQQGYVKTIGKPGKKGVALSGVTVRAKGNHNAVVSKSNGRFSMKMKGLKNGDAYSLQQVQKKGYELNDAGTLGRQYAFSSIVPLTIVMVSTAQLQADIQRIENNAYAVAEKNYKAKMAKLEKQLNENTITAEEYRAALQELQNSFEKYQSLIENLADHYAHTDYDMLDENEAEINTLIENGELEKADSLIHTLFDPIDVLKRNKEALSRLDQTIADAQGILNQANTDMAAVLKQQDKDAEYLYQLYTIALAQFDNERAAKYIQTRAELDTTNVQWQYDAGEFLHDYLANINLALDYYQLGLRQSLKQYGKQSEWYAKFCWAMSLTYNYQGNLEKASYYSQKLIEICELNDSVENPVMGMSYSSFAYLCVSKGDYDKALEYYKKALDIYEREYGTEHDNIATAYNNIGSVYYIKGDYDNALEYHKKALDIYEREYGTEHKRIATFYNNIGLNYYDKGDLDKALEYYQKALDISERILGTDHPFVATYYNNIGLVYDKKGDYDKALNYFKKALGNVERIYGTDHPHVAITYSNTGCVYSRKGDHDKALEYHDKALDIQERILSTDHPDIASTYNNIGLVYSRKGDYDKALEYYLKALGIDERVFGMEHPEVASTIQNIGSSYYRKGDYDKALVYYLKALGILERVLGTEHPDVANLYNHIGSVYENIGDYDKALVYYLKVLGIRERILGTDNPQIATYYNYIGGLYSRKGDYDKALESYQKALDIRERIIGTDHPDTQKVKERIDEMKELMGQ